VDRHFSTAASKAHRWLTIKPGTDLVPLLAWIHVLIKEVSSQGWGLITPDKAADFIDDVDPFILDVRTPKEWDETGVIPGAVTITLTELDQYLSELPPLNKPILVYCKAGARGQYALTYLKVLGYKNVKNLKGGIIAWINAGFEVTKK